MLDDCMSELHEAFVLGLRFALFNCLKVTRFSIIQVVKPVVARFHHRMVCAPYCTEMLVLFFHKNGMATNILSSND